MTDDELKWLLHMWQTAPAPAALRERVFRKRKTWRSWLVTGEVKVPVPVAFAAVCVLLFLAYFAFSRPASSLSDFQQVQEFKPRIVRNINENR